MRRRSLLTFVALGALILSSVGPASAHNPADTVYEPTRLDDGLLALGEEGTAALLEMDGTPRWEEDVSAHVIQAPVTSGGHAATVARTIPNATPFVQAFDGDGPAWRVPLDETESFGAVVATTDGFLAVSTNGALVSLTADGEVLERTSLSYSPQTAPVPAPGGGWVIAGEEGKIAIRTPDGELVHETRLGGPARDLARMGDLILAAFERAGHPTVKALDAELETQWIAERDGLRIGGQLAVAEDRIYLGTYRSNGARAVALAPNGTELWDHAFPRKTAAAVTTDGTRPYVTVNQGLLALEPDGPVRWQIGQIQPRLVGPAIVGDLVLPSGADNKLAAFHASNGTLMWSYSDGVDQVPWSDESLGSGDQGHGDGGNDAPWPVAIALVAVGAAAAAARRMR